MLLRLRNADDAFSRADEDEESTEWEYEQLRRGGHLKSDPSSKAKVKQTYKPAPSKS